MIITVFLNTLYFFLNGLLSILPTGILPPIIANSVAYFVGVVNSFSYVIPVATIFEAFALVVSVDIAILLWHFINWIIRKIPGMQ